MMEGDIPALSPMPKGFLNLERFDKELKRAIRGATSLDTPEGRHTFAQTVLCEMLAVEEENHLDIEYLVDHMADEKSGVIRDILNRDNSPAAQKRMELLHREICEFEEHRDEKHVPRKTDEPEKPQE